MDKNAKYYLSDNLFYKTISDLYKEYGLFQRLIKIDGDFPGANVLLHKTGDLPQVLFMVSLLYYFLVYTSKHRHYLLLSPILC